MTADKLNELRQAWVTADDEYQAALAAITRTSGEAKHTAWHDAEDRRRIAQTLHDDYNRASVEFDREFRTKYGGPEFGL